MAKALYTVNFESPPPEIYVLANHGAHLCPKKDYAQYQDDPRGVLWMWEPPHPHSTYVVGIDPTRGIPGWTREMRMTEDVRVDNGTIEVIKVGRSGRPDTQVAEFAAPIGPRDLAWVANTVGRIYAGNGNDGQALVVPEVWPGPGLLLVNEFQLHCGYHNIYVHAYASRSGGGLSTSIGFSASLSTVRDLWIEGLRHIENEGLIVNSPALVDEMNDCFIDQTKQRGQAVHGAHDDRVSALLMALWAAHDWSGQVSHTVQTEEVRARREMPDWQSGDFDEEDMAIGMNRKFIEIVYGNN